MLNAAVQDVDRHSIAYLCAGITADVGVRTGDRAQKCLRPMALASR